MRVLIAAPPYPLEESPAPPLGISYAAAAFEAAGAEVKVIDYIVSRYTREKLKKELDTFSPDIVGTNSVTMNFPAAVDIIQTAKRHNPSLITMMGGPHVSFDAVNTLQKYPEIDLLMIGEGEGTIMELVPCISDHRDWAGIKGITFRRNGEFVVTEQRGLIDDLDSLPLPARHLLPLSRYLALGFPVSIITSRGCPHSCIFCLGRRMLGNGSRYRKPSLVVDEIEQVLSYGFPWINITDDLFTSSKPRVREICEEIRRRRLNFSWSAFSRCNNVDRETFELMHSAGCNSVSFGIESGNPEMLKRIRKGITPDLARKAISACREAGITPHASFMVGLPGESPETLRNTAELAKSLDILHGYHFLAPFPGTTVREEIDKYDLEILTDDWAQYDANRAIVRTSKLFPEDLERFVAEYENEMNEAWEDLVQGYREKTNLPEDDLKVEAHFRLQLVYRLLSEDIIETCGSFQVNNPGSNPGDPVDILCRKIAEATGFDTTLVNKTIKRFVDSGYLKSRSAEENIVWYWTHNHQVDS
ncbi:MAG: radical SAM protein [Deltaproteobacteria bacterium]|nr:MAG: radical SAM protein [Deltaproteobacteria bacterium]